MQAGVCDVPPLARSPSPLPRLHLPSSPSPPRSGTGSAGATIRMYIEAYTNDASSFEKDAQEVLKGIIGTALEVRTLWSGHGLAWRGGGCGGPAPGSAAAVAVPAAMVVFACCTLVWPRLCVEPQRPCLPTTLLTSVPASASLSCRPAS